MPGTKDVIDTVLIPEIASSMVLCNNNFASTIEAKYVEFVERPPIAYEKKFYTLSPSLNL